MNIDGIFFFLPSPRALLQGLRHIPSPLDFSILNLYDCILLFSVRFFGKGSLFCAFSRISKRLEIEVEMGKFPRLQN